MVKVLGPQNIQITAPSVAGPVRSSPTAFGSPQADALQDLGQGIQRIGAMGQRLADERQSLDDATFLAKVESETDIDFDSAALDEDYSAPGASDRLTSTFQQRGPQIVERLRGEGLNPSDEALRKAEIIQLRKTGDHARRALINEHNFKVGRLVEDAQTTVATVAMRAARSGDVRGAVSAVESSLANFDGRLDPGRMSALRRVAADSLVNAFSDRPDLLDDAVETILEADRNFSQDNPETRGGRIQRSAASEDFQIPEAERRTLPAGMRNNNPGNIKYTSRRAFAGVTGPSENTDQGDPQAVFSTPQEGMNAAADLALRKYQSGKTTAMSLIAGRMGWTPGNTQAAANVARTLGIGPNDDLQLGNPENMARFLKALTLQEHGQASKMYPDALYSRAAGLLDRDDRAFSLANQMPDSLQGNFVREMLSRAPQFREARRKMEERRALAVRGSRLISGDELMDPESKDDRKTIDAMVEATDFADLLRARDEGAQRQLFALTQRIGYVPEAAVSAMRAMSANGTGEEQAFALHSAAAILNDKPGALQTSEDAKALRDDATLFSAMTQAQGLSEQAALLRLREMRTPEFQSRAKAREEEVDKLLKTITADSLAGEFGGGWFTSEPELGAGPGDAAVVLSDYRDLVRYHFNRSGDFEAAKAAGRQDLKRTWGVSEFNGTKRFMQYPPERVWPAIMVRRGYFDTQYAKHQLVRDVNEYVNGGGKRFGQANPELRGVAITAAARAAKDIPLEKIFLTPIRQTKRDLAAGITPGYAVSWLEERDGIPVLNTAPGFVWKPDIKAAREKTRAIVADVRQDAIAKQEDRDRMQEKSRTLLKRLFNPSADFVEKDGQAQPQTSEAAEPWNIVGATRRAVNRRALPADAVTARRKRILDADKAVGDTVRHVLGPLGEILRGERSMPTDTGAADRLRRGPRVILPGSGY